MRAVRKEEKVIVMLPVEAKRPDSKDRAVELPPLSVVDTLRWF